MRRDRRRGIFAVSMAPDLAGERRVSSSGYRFDLVDLRLFVNIAEAKSLSRGSERSNISLAAASTRIKNLELNLDAQLFERTSRGVSLTEAGETLARHARAVLQQLDLLNAEFRQQADRTKGKLRIAANISAISSVIPNVISGYLRAYPDVQIEMKRYLSVDCLKTLREGLADVALVAMRVHEPGIESFQIRAERYVIVMPQGHPLEARDGVTFAESLDYDHIGIGDSAIQHPHYARVAREAGKVMRYRIHVGSSAEVCRLVADGNGVAVLPSSAAAHHGDMPISIRPLTDTWLQRELQVCVQTPHTRPKFVYDFVDLVRASGDEGHGEGA